MSPEEACRFFSLWNVWYTVNVKTMGECERSLRVTACVQ